MSLRRSARAPTAQPVVTARQHTNSSASSVSSSRLDRNSRLNQKAASPHGSIPPGSQSPEDPENPMIAPLRRTRSDIDQQKTESSRTLENTKNDVHEEEEEEEEEETRCICGQLEYPGLPVTSSNNTKATPQIDSDPISEDSTGWFIQCDDCQVWQHGGCVGILDERENPEKYFCERCRKDLHEVDEDVNGRKYSRYLPVQDSHSPTPSPTSKGKDTAKRTRESRVSRTELDALAKGRRATMNSRDSAYDEAEQLRRAIEESKRDSLAKSTSTRKGKRGRSESEERDDDAKRRRTASGSSSSQSKQHRQGPGSDDEAQKEKYKNVRGAAARNHRAKELREREAREKERGESNKRKPQNHKRRADDPDLSPEPTSRAVSARGGAPANRSAQAAASKSHKKGGRPPARKGRLGRNQYSKDRDPPTQGHNLLSPRSNNSHDGEPSCTNGGTHGNGIAESNGLGKPSRPRHMNPNRTSLNDMKRRVAAILEFISHTQVEMAALDAAKSRTSSTKGSSGSIPTPPQRKDPGGQEKETLKDISGMLSALGETEMVDEEAFGKLNAVEMMEVLTRRLMRWQSQYGKYGEK